MVNDTKNTEKLRKIVSLLPKENCGKCGYDNCGAFAVALVAGKASPLDCHKSRSSVKEICEVLGMEVPEGAELPAAGHGRGHHGHHSHHGGDGHHGHGKGRGGHRHPGGHHARRHVE